MGSRLRAGLSPEGRMRGGLSLGGVVSHLVQVAVGKLPDGRVYRRRTYYDGGLRHIHVRTTRRLRDGQPLQVFGRGSSQQEDFVPTLNGAEPTVLFVWWEADVTTTLSVSVDDRGVPLCCWLDRSST